MRARYLWRTKSANTDTGEAEDVKLSMMFKLLEDAADGRFTKLSISVRLYGCQLLPTLGIRSRKGSWVQRSLSHPSTSQPDAVQRGRNEAIQYVIKKRDTVYRKKTIQNKY
jgi:hypothetical protein